MEEKIDWKALRTCAYIGVAISVAVFAFCVCFRAWADKEVFVHRLCAHKYIGRAVLVDKGAYGFGCHWKPDDRPKVDERWDTCREFEAGDVNTEYVEVSYSCEDLAANK